MTGLQKNNNKGFTLIEVITAIAISAFVIMAAYSVVIVGSRSYSSTSSITSLQQEITFSTNIVGEAVRNGTAKEAEIKKYNDTDNNGDVMIYLGDGKRVFYYSAKYNSLYVFEAVAGEAIDSNEYKVLNDSDVSSKIDHLVSKYIKSFDAENIANDSSPATIDYYAGTNTKGYSNLIKVTITAEFKKRTDTSAVVYNIRN